MGAASGITAALAGAKNTLKEANDKFPSPKPSGQHAAAPYKMARKATVAVPAKPDDEVEDTGKSLGDKAANIKAYKDAQ
jgi:hypothetical protein